jgi:hypothetical protein
MAQAAILVGGLILTRVHYGQNFRPRHLEEGEMHYAFFRRPTGACVHNAGTAPLVAKDIPAFLFSHFSFLRHLTFLITFIQSFLTIAMAIFSKILSVLVTAAVVAAQHDTGAHLTKPTLHSNLDYLKSGLIASLPETQFKIDQWGAGWIPQGCKNIAEGKVESSVTYNPADFNIFNVHYSDVCV